MRKKLSVKLSTFIKALESLGYRRCRNPRQMEWRRGNFHLILNQGKGYLNVSLHVDIPVYKVGSIHRSRRYGRDITEEFKRIKKEYIRLKGCKVIA